MAKTKITADFAYTPAEQLAMWNQASMELARSGVSRSVHGRTLTVANGAEVREMINHWQAKVSISQARPGSRTNIARHARR